jgi:hypothetical protein
MLLTTAGDLFAQGNLLIMPKRVVFEGSKRYEELNLANIGKDSATYVLSFVQMRMNENGTFQQITNPDSLEHFSDKNVRFFPRSVTLAPNEAQSIKMQLVKTNELAPGEYRSHLYFRALPKEKPLGEPEVKNDTSISISLVPVFGISIPVIIRVGENDGKVAISDVAYTTVKDTIPSLQFTFTRKGKMSVYGDIAVEHIADNGVKTPVALVKGMAVYTPNTTRKSHIMLNKVNGVNFHSGKLHIKYVDQSPRQNVLAENTVTLN